MANIGILSPPLQGHLNPMIALALELKQRGHTLTFFSIPDVEDLVVRYPLGFCAIAKHQYPKGSLHSLQQQIARQSSMSAMLSWNRIAIDLANHTAPELPSLLVQHQIDLLLADQIDLLGVSVGEFLSIPCISICNTLLTNWEPSIPPPFVGLDYADTPYSREMNQLVFDKIKHDFSPVFETIQRWRKQWGLLPFDTCCSLFPESEWGQVAQQPAAFDFPRTRLATNFRYTAPFRLDTPDAIHSFPFEKRSSKPLVYASLGTLVNNHAWIFQAIATACQHFDVQLVIAIGKEGDLSAFANLPGDPLVVQYAPQQVLLKDAVLTITHAGLNTVLDSLANGVPMIAIPISFDQAGTAARIKWTGTGEVLTLRRVSCQTIHDTIEKVLTHPSYVVKAQNLQKHMQKGKGTSLAANYIEQIFQTQNKHPEYSQESMQEYSQEYSQDALEHSTLLSYIR